MCKSTLNIVKNIGKYINRTEFKEKDNPNWNKCRAIIANMTNKGTNMSKEFVALDMIGMSNPSTALAVLRELGEIKIIRGGAGKAPGIYVITENFKLPIKTIPDYELPRTGIKEGDLNEVYIMTNILKDYKIIGRLIHNESGTSRRVKAGR